MKKEIVPLQQPFFFLSKGQGLQKLEIIPDGGNKWFSFNDPFSKRKLLSGKRSAKRENRIIFQLPKGKEIDIRPHNPYLLRKSSDASNFEFELGLIFLYFF